MNNVPSILIVDNNKAFATMLREGLEQDGKYQTTVTASGDEALQALSAGEFDLAIVDLGVDDPGGTLVLHSLRQQQPDLRLMLIPLMGEELEPGLADLDIQGILTKPFFLPELPEHITDALSKSVSTAAPAGAETAAPNPVSDQPIVSSAKGLDMSPDRAREITRALAGLSREINAEAVILTHEEEVIASAGRLSAEKVDALAQAVAASWRTSARVAQILGRRQPHFEQSVEGGKHMFYSLAVTGDVILSAALYAGVSLGMIRHQIKTTANALKKLVGTIQ